MPRVNVRFDYYKVTLSENAAKEVDIAPLLGKFKTFSDEDRTMEYVQSNIIKLLKVEYHERYTYSYLGETVKTVSFPFWYVVFTRSRPDLPGVLKEKATELVPLKLPDDEYISDHTVFIYDPRTCVAIIQRNMAGTPASAIQKMFNMHLINKNSFINLTPIMDETALARAQQQVFHRSITVRSSNIQQISSELDESSPMKAIMESSLGFIENPQMPLQVEICIKIPGRGRKVSLKDKVIDNLITKLGSCTSDKIIDKLVVKGATDEQAPIEEIDLISDVLRGCVAFNTDESRFIHADYIMEKMLHDYVAKRSLFL